ncbi:hypothetical protein ANO11243_025520 [Dothideomycetidae sp. 11243]|nr:hypothetical protein ANO11243_025520 [fungal sp. No.11243]
MNPAQLLNPKAFAKDAAKKKPQAQQAFPISPRSATPITGPALTQIGRPSSNGTSAVTMPSFNPATLLNPKLAMSKSKADPQPKDIQNHSIEEGDPNSGGNSLTSLLEKHHGVSKRQAAPMKRIKDSTDQEQDPDSPKKRAKFTDGVGKGGVIGESVREMRQQGQDERGVPTGIVDLTEDDDELTIVSSRHVGPDPNQEVCIGTISSKMHAHRVPFVSSRALDGLKGRWPPSRVALRILPGQTFVIDVLDKKGNAFGKLDVKESHALAQLLNGSKVHGMRCSAFLTDRPKKQGQETGHSISEQMDIRIVIFCFRKAAEGIRKVLSQKNVYLQFPSANTEGKEIVYPQIKDFSPRQVVAPGRSGQTVNVSYYVRTVEEIKSDVQNIIDNLPNSEGLPFMEADPEVVETSLLDHQKQALYWMTTKETPSKDGEGTLWKSRVKKDGSPCWYNVISGTEAKEIPISKGGLFSDDMGLGKTLSILSLLATTLEEADTFADQRPTPDIIQEHPSVEKNTKATLIVCPKSVLSNWDEQIRTHINSKKISFYSYHGDKREQDLDELVEFDIVLTSYSIVESEFRNRNVKGKFRALNRLNWFRVVLDEAHQIRNMTTGAFNSCCALASSRRWAVTGTPVQNRLDDLGALIRFIRVAPFHEKGQWEMNFTSAWKSGNEQVLPNLKLLVSSTMLRRSKKKINIEDPDMKTIALDFTDEERGLYEAFAKDSFNKMDAMMRDGKLGARGTAHMLTFITRLRLICAHGKELLSDDDMKLLDGATIGTAIDLGDDDDERPVMTDYQIYNFLIMMRDSNSNCCLYDAKEEIGKDQEATMEEDTSSSEDESDGATGRESSSADVMGYMTPCYHLVCPKHMAHYKEGIKQSLTADGYANCPSCNNYIRASFPPILRSGLEAEESRRATARTTTTAGKAKNTGTYSGPHTKVRALLERLQQNNIDSAPLIAAGEPPIRSVVFSGWTQYLDLISLALTESNIPHLRLDGKLSVRSRTAVLSQFRTDPSIQVLLVSIRAGGQGLNLTAASKVYVMEPQFNPGVEMQAVDRVHRLGQTRKVEIVKFVMADSFELRIIKLQEQKMRLAREAFGEAGGKGEGEKTARERMEGLRSLFK